MDWIVEGIQKLDIANLVAIAAMLWIGYNRLDKKIERLEATLRSEMQKSEAGLRSEMQKSEGGLRSEMQGIHHRLDKMHETITDIDRRLCRLEGAFHSKECCLLKSDSANQKAE